MVSHFSGWRNLAATYAFPDRFVGELRRFQSAKIGWVSFGNALEVGGNRTGLYLRPFIVFRPFHKPLLIPWQELEAEPFTKFFVFKGQKIRIKSHPSMRLELYCGAFDKICDTVASELRLGVPDRGSA